jgi:hypothetical protein
MVGADGKCTTLDIRPPMSDDLDKADQLTLVGRQLLVVLRYRSGEIGDGTVALMQDGAESSARGVAVDDEAPIEIGHL